MLQRFRLLAVMVISVLLSAQASAQMAAIRVFSDSPMAPALKQIATLYHGQSGHEVQLTVDLSPRIAQMVKDGEPGDVVIIQPEFIKDLVDAKKLGAGEYPTIARIGIGLFTRATAPSPDVSTVESFKSALLDADSIVFSNVAAGNYFATVIERLGINEQIKLKIKRGRPPDVVSRIIQGNGKDIGVMVITLINADPRLRLIGSLPGEFQRYLTYSAAPIVSSRAPGAAEQFIRYLASSEAKVELAKAGADSGANR